MRADGTIYLGDEVILEGSARAMVSPGIAGLTFVICNLLLYCRHSSYASCRCARDCFRRSIHCIAGGKILPRRRCRATPRWGRVGGFCGRPIRHTTEFHSLWCGGVHSPLHSRRIRPLYFGDAGAIATDASGDPAIPYRSDC